MAKQKVKPIHFIYIGFYTGCFAVCGSNIVIPIEYKLNSGGHDTNNIGTFDVTKVTCKKCFKKEFYKEALDKIKYPLFFWRQGL